MQTKEITLTAREILDLAKCAGFMVFDPKMPLDADALEIEYTIIEREGGVPVGDEDGKNPKLYNHGAYITEYFEEGTYPLGEPLPTPAPAQGEKGGA